MTAAQQRKVQRGVHLIAALVLIGYLYAPTGTQLQDVVPFVVLPVLVVTGIAMWQAARIRRLWRTLSRRRALDPATSASPAERGAERFDVARATTGARG
ncbi:MAG: hypothetical protein ACT4PO_15650 [Actinomycetota bacterium]